MSDDTLLRERVREAMQAGILPKRSPDELWGGPATGAQCAVCGASTTAGEIELEFQFSGEPKGRARYFAHARCFSIFSRELENIEEP